MEDLSHMVIHVEIIVPDSKVILHTRFMDLKVEMVYISKIIQMMVIAPSILTSKHTNVTIKEPLRIQPVRD